MIKTDGSTRFEVSTHDDVIIVEAVPDAERVETVRRGIEAMNDRYSGVFKRLAGQPTVR